MSQQEKTAFSTSVIYVHPKNAKTVKCILEKVGALDKRFRMKKTTSGCSSNDITIAIPVQEFFATRWKEGYEYEGIKIQCSELILGKGVIECPLSTSLLGNGGMTDDWRKDGGEDEERTTVVQWSILEMLSRISSASGAIDKLGLMRSIKELDSKVCPNHLEKLGKGTLIIPRGALTLSDDAFRLLFFSSPNSKHTHLEDIITLSPFWEILAKKHKCSRVARRGEINPDDGRRESGHRILWPQCGSPDGIPKQTGPNSPGWVTITENQVLQSFDMTRVMFSRGNISEKIRFAALVTSSEEIILDMYAGIGYYTLPALLKCQVKHVHACEWNPHAIFSLEFNLKQNNVRDRVTIHHGDCRHNVSKTIIGKIPVDRVVLGLLPSSQGGWGPATQALLHNGKGGGWMHVHGNVPLCEIHNWTIWLCQSLAIFTTHEQDKWNDWMIICAHVEEVKSYAPRVKHCVADVFVGNKMLWDTSPFATSKFGVAVSPDNVAKPGCLVGLLDKEGLFEAAPLECVNPPSCALGKTNVLFQDWMMTASCLD